MRCCGTKWSVLYSVLVLGSMVRMKLTLTFFSIPDSRTTNVRIKTLKQQFALRCCKDCLHRQDSTIGWRVESARSKSAVHDSFTINAPLLLLSATYSKNKVHFFSRNSHRQTQIRHTGFPTLTILSDDARLFLLDICSSKDSHSEHMSLESDVTLLISGEASDPSTLGYGGKPSQEKRHLY